MLVVIDKELIVPYFLPIISERIDRFILFLIDGEIQKALSRFYMNESIYLSPHVVNLKI